jgi:hypothetical protein
VCYCEDFAMFSELTREELAAGLDCVAMEILEEAEVTEPPVDAFTVAKRLGIAVAWDDRQEGRARYVQLNPRWSSGTFKATILLKPDPRNERRQWAVAHEIGEHAAHRVFQRLQIDPRETPQNTRESVANQMAGRILLPSEWFEKDGTTFGWDLFALKIRYRTASHELIVRRMLECRPTVLISIFDQTKISWRRGNLPGRTPPPSADEMTCWHKVHAQNRPVRCQGRFHRVQGWPIHEEGWAREILRTEVDEILDSDWDF